VNTISFYGGVVVLFFLVGWFWLKFRSRLSDLIKVREVFCKITTPIESKVDCVKLGFLLALLTIRSCS
jgi:hypothetical protein